MNCPTCNSEMWDNRPNKQSGKFKANGPDFKCKNPQCGSVIWPPKQDARPPIMPPAQRNVVQAPPSKVEHLLEEIRDILLDIRNKGDNLNPENIKF